MQHGNGKRHRRTAGNVALAICLGLALFLQSLVVQTHMHVPLTGGGDISLTLGYVTEAPHAGPAHHDGTVPGDTDHSDCPFCQAIVMGGGYLLPSIPILALPPFVAVVEHIASSIVFHTSTLSYGWSSRAPPAHL